MKVVSMSMGSRVYYGSAAHYINAAQCRFHLATKVGDVVVSTVGDYHPRSNMPGEPAETIGSNWYFETMVFRIIGMCGCGCGLPEHDGQQIDFAGYQTAGQANAGHEAMCVKYEHSALPVGAAT